MTTHVLEGNGRTVIGRRQLTITVSGVRERTVQIVVVGPDERELPVLRPRPGLVVLDEVRGRVSVRVRPHPGPAFPDGTVLSVRLATEPTAYAEADQVVVQSLEVSRRTSRDVVEIEAVNDRELAVTASDVIPEVPLPLLGAAARSAARTRLGADRTPDPVEVRVAVDMSASMAPAVADGVVGAALDVLSGVAQVAGAGTRVRVTLLTGHAVSLPAVPATELAASTVAQVRQLGLGYGFRSAPPDVAGGPGTVTYVLTDAVPADAAALRDTGTAHLVVLGATGSTAEPGDAPNGLPTTRWPGVPPRTDVTEHLLARPDTLADLVGSLLPAAGRPR